MKATTYGQQRAGITLIEVLFAIFITGIGLLALLVLFPLGVMDLARAIQDDRADKLANDAAVLTDDGRALLERTEDFISDSLANGSADPQEAAALRMAYEDFDDQAADLQAGLKELKPLAQTPRVRKQLSLSLSQIKAIRAGAKTMVQLLELLEDSNSSSYGGPEGQATAGCVTSPGIPHPPRSSPP
jgi:hypothetical protein